MKVLHLADLHINVNANRLGKVSPNHEVAANRYEIIHTILAENPADVYVFSGDIFDKAHPLPADYADFRGLLDSIHTGTIFIITGNHDEYTQKGCALLHGGFNDINGNPTWIFSKIFTTKINNYTFIGAPWGTTLDEIKKVNPENAILVLHGGVKDDKHQWVEVEGETSNYELQDLIDLNCKAILLGHHHNQEKLAPNIWYAGSPDIVSGFGEEKDRKGALLWTFTDDKVEVKRISSSVSLWKTFTPEEFLNKNTEEFNGYVRIKGEVTEKERLDIIAKVKEFPCTDYKLDLQSKIKKTKIKTVKGHTDTERLESYLKAKKVNNIKELIKLDKELCN